MSTEGASNGRVYWVYLLRVCLLGVSTEGASTEDASTGRVY